MPLATVNPGGSVSVKATPVRVGVFALVIVKFNELVRPALIVVGLNTSELRGAPGR